MDLCKNKKLEAARGDFGARVVGKKTKRLALPSKVFEILTGFRIETAEELFKAVFGPKTQDCLQAVLNKELGWTVSDYMQASTRLKSCLNGHVSDHLLYPFGRQELRRSRRGEPRERRRRVGT